MRRGVAGLNEPLLGVAGGRARLETPALLLDADRFEASLGGLAQMASSAGMGLRPHAKSHKCAEIARRQMAAGALGIACAKPGELLALFEAGLTRLMLTAPVASPLKIARLAQASAQGLDLIVVVDRADLVSAFGQAAITAGTTVGVLVDIDTGLGRTGVTTPAEALALAQQVASTPGLRFDGVQAYNGKVQHIFDHVERRAANVASNDRLTPILAALTAAGLPARIVSGGGTGSHLLDFEQQVLTEVQAGSYVFMDEGYRPVDLHGAGARVFDFAMLVVVSVIGHSANGEAITDAGSKSFAIDGPQPRVHLDGREIGTIAWAGDEFGRVKTYDGIAPPAAGTRLECTVPHCDPTVNLHDFIHLVRGDRLEAIWAVEARGLSD